MICMLIEVRVKASALDEFLKVIKNDAVHSEKDEPGCMRFDVLRDADDPLKFYFYEVYKDKAAQAAQDVQLQGSGRVPEIRRFAADERDVPMGDRGVAPAIATESGARSRKAPRLPSCQR